MYSFGEYKFLLPPILEKFISDTLLSIKTYFLHFYNHFVTDTCSNNTFFLIYILHIIFQQLKLIKIKQKHLKNLKNYY